jgi:hypothetical protein
VPHNSLVSGREADVIGNDEQDLAHDLVLPTLLFAALGAMTWAVRGCVLLFAVSALILFHFRYAKTHELRST